MAIVMVQVAIVLLLGAMGVVGVAAVAGHVGYRYRKKQADEPHNGDDAGARNRAAAATQRRDDGRGPTVQYNDRGGEVRQMDIMFCMPPSRDCGSACVLAPAQPQSVCGQSRDGEGQGPTGDVGSEAPTIIGEVCRRVMSACGCGGFRGGESLVCRLDADTALELVQRDPNLELKKLVYGNETTRLEHYETMKQNFMNSKEGVMLWFPGHGQQGTGDWIFKDNEVITFLDVFGLYHNYFMGHNLTIVCDCCYSGHWVEKLASKLDEYGIPPCGHRAKAVDFKVKIIASCKKHQQSRDRLFLRKGITISEDGTLTFQDQVDISDDQTTVSLDTTEIRCTAGVHGTCNLPHGAKWRDIVDREIE